MFLLSYHTHGKLRRTPFGFCAGRNSRGETGETPSALHRGFDSLYYQEGYNVDLLDTSRKGGSTSPEAHAPLASNHGHVEAALSKEELASYPGHMRAVPWWRTKKFIVFSVIFAVVAIAAIVGGAVGGTVHHNKNNNNAASVSSSSTSTAPTATSGGNPGISGGGGDSGTDPGQGQSNSAAPSQTGTSTAVAVNVALKGSDSGAVAGEVD